LESAEGRKKERKKVRNAVGAGSPNENKAKGKEAAS